MGSKTSMSRWRERMKIENASRRRFFSAHDGQAIRRQRETDDLAVQFAARATDARFRPGTAGNEPVYMGPGNETIGDGFEGGSYGIQPPQPKAPVFWWDEPTPEQRERVLAEARKRAEQNKRWS